MGLSNAVSGGIILVALVFALMTVPKLMDSTLSLQEVSSSVANLEDSIASTLISVDTLVAPTVNSDEITFSVNGLGEEKLWNFERFNVIVTYDGASGKSTEPLSYAGACSGQPAEGTWCVDSISDDILDPGILNYGESLEVKSTLAEDVSSGIVIVVVGTDNGVVATTSGLVP